MRKLKISLSDLEMAFDNGDPMISYYLDIENSEVIRVTDDERRLLENIYETYYDEQTQTVDWQTAFQQKQVPDWQRQMLQDIDRVEAGFGSRFIAISSEGSDEGYRDMEAFIVTVHNPRLQERLEYAISGRGAFRHFKDVLLDYPAERERWFEFQQKRLDERIRDWLEAEEIELIPKDSVL